MERLVAAECHQAILSAAMVVGAESQRISRRALMRNREYLNRMFSARSELTTTRTDDVPARKSGLSADRLRHCIGIESCQNEPPAKQIIRPHPLPYLVLVEHSAWHGNLQHHRNHSTPRVQRLGCRDLQLLNR